MKKQILIKVYRPTGEFITTWKKASFKSFEKEINGGFGECIIILGEKFDYAGEDLLLGNDIEILISDKDTISDAGGYRTIYKGYISLIEPYINGKKETISISVLGHYTKLELDIWRDSATKTTTFDYGTDTDFSTMFRNLMDKYISETDNPKLSYTDKSIELTGTVGQYMFEMTTYKEAINKIKNMSPVGWYWYVNEIGRVYFKKKADTPDHTFIFGKHFSSVTVSRSLEKIRNTMLFWNGETGVNQIYKLYEDDASIKQYGKRAMKYFDWNVGNEATADKIADKFLANSSIPDIKVVVEIGDNNDDEINGYDIENIQAGDTCAFRGFNDEIAELFRENMLITKVIYSLSKVQLIIEIQRAGMIAWQNETSKKIDEYFSDGSPAVYT